MRQRSRPAVPDDAAVVENLLELGGCGTALPGCQVCLSDIPGRLAFPVFKIILSSFLPRMRS